MFRNKPEYTMSFVSGCCLIGPFFLDRDTNGITAGIASINAVLSSPGLVLLWGALVVTLLLAALLVPWSLGVLLVGPWLGHATWHAYRGSYST